MDDPEERTQALTARADVARSRLAATLGALQKRRQEVFELPGQLVRNGRVAGILVAGLTAGAIVAFAVYRYRSSTSGRRLRHERWLLLQRAWEHPERVLRPKPQPSLMAKLVRGLAASAVRMVVTKLVASAAQAHMQAPAGEDRQIPDRL
jgi:hypothetical protein